jgi:hypothetical protein
VPRGTSMRKSCAGKAPRTTQIASSTEGG